MMTVDLGCIQGKGQTPGVRPWHGTYLLAEDACYGRGRTSRLRRSQTDAVVGPEIVESCILMKKSISL